MHPTVERVPRSARARHRGADADQAMGTAHQEIERVWLLREHPQLPRDAERWVIEQGYLHAGASTEGRIRRITRPDGRITHVHTSKRGMGMVREEIEREIDASEFGQLWPSTEGRRIAKVRHRVRESGLVWEVDAFTSIPLHMAEVELPAADTPVGMPEWLCAAVVREVTDDPRYRNSSLALHGLPR